VEDRGLRALCLFLCLPLIRLGLVGCLGKVGPCGGTGSSLAGRVFRLGGLWWPKSLRSKATHTPAILEATRATLPAPDLAKAGTVTRKWGLKPLGAPNFLKLVAKLG